MKFGPKTDFSKLDGNRRHRNIYRKTKDSMQLSKDRLKLIIYFSSQSNKRKNVDNSASRSRNCLRVERDLSRLRPNPQ